MDDIDVFKCREGRLDYLGLLSFMAIAVPMTVILLNEFIGDAILDAVIPGIYAGVLVMGATLYTVSLLALLLPFCLVIGILWYMIFIYRPAQHAHNRRKEVLKRRLLEDSLSTAHSFRQNGSSARFRGSAFGRQTLTGYLARVRTIAKHGIQDGITWISGGELRLRDPRKHLVQRDWCHLNMLPCYQGLIYEQSVESKDRSLSLVVPSRHAMFLPPVKISNMMTSSTQWKALYQHRQKGLNNDVANILDDSDQLVVTCPMIIDRSLRPVRSPIVFDPSEILTRLWTKVATSYPDAPRGSKEVSMECLHTEFQAILTVYYPDGIRLSEAEKAEACEMFTYWREWRYLDEEYVRSPRSGMEIVSFFLFDEWFTDKLVNALRGRLPERLLDHSLHHMPIMKRRLQMASPTLQLDRSPSFKSHSPRHRTSPRKELLNQLKEENENENENEENKRNSCSTLEYEKIYDTNEVDESYGTPPTHPLTAMDNVFAMPSKHKNYNVTTAEAAARLEYCEIYDSLESESFTSPMPRSLSPTTTPIPTLAFIPTSTTTLTSLTLLQTHAPHPLQLQLLQSNTETYTETEAQAAIQTHTHTNTQLHTQSFSQACSTEQNTISNTISQSISLSPISADNVFALPATAKLHFPPENIQRKSPKKGSSSNRWASISSRSSHGMSSDIPTITTSLTNDSSSIAGLYDFDDLAITSENENEK